MQKQKVYHFKNTKSCRHQKNNKTFALFSSSIDKKLLQIFQTQKKEKTENINCITTKMSPSTYQPVTTETKTKFVFSKTKEKLHVV